MPVAGDWVGGTGEALDPVWLQPASSITMITKMADILQWKNTLVSSSY
jgi:hypothetical protein